jgi:hypothetical protein
VKKYVARNLTGSIMKDLIRVYNKLINWKIIRNLIQTQRVAYVGLTIPFTTL